MLVLQGIIVTAKSVSLPSLAFLHHTCWLLPINGLKQLKSIWIILWFLRLILLSLFSAQWHSISFFQWKLFFKELSFFNIVFLYVHYHLFLNISKYLATENHVVKVIYMYFVSIIFCDSDCHVRVLVLFSFNKKKSLFVFSFNLVFLISRNECCMFIGGKIASKLVMFNV